MIIEYCEKCSTRIDAACYMDPLNAAKYCRKCGTGNHALVPFDIQQKPISVQDKKCSSSARLKTPSGARLKAAMVAQMTADAAPVARSSQPPESFNKHVGNMAFYFCEKCGRRLSETDLAQGLAKNKQIKGVYCASCSVGVNTMEMDAISLDELSAVRRKNLESRPETVEVGQNTVAHTPRATQKPAPVQKKKAGPPVQVVLLLLALAAFILGMNLPSNSPDPKTVSSNPKIEAKNKEPQAKLPVRETPPAPKIDSAVKTPVVTEVKPEPPSQPVKPEPLTDRQIQAEREQQALREMQELRAKREAQLKEAQSNPDSKPETPTVAQGETSGNSQTSSKVRAEADAYVRGGDHASTNFGTAGTLDTKRGGQSQSYERKAYIRFDLTNQPTPIKSAKLRIYAVLAQAATRSVQHVADDTWQENAINWGNAPAPGTVLGTWQPMAGQFTEVDITEAIQKELAGDKKISLLIQATNNEGKNSGANFASREGDNGPELVIEYSSPNK